MRTSNTRAALLAACLLAAAPGANGKRRCSFEVTNDMCGDPSHGDRKSLDVTYICGALAKTANANEHRTLYLDCTP